MACHEGREESQAEGESTKIIPARKRKTEGISVTRGCETVAWSNVNNITKTKRKISRNIRKTLIFEINVLS